MKKEFTAKSDSLKIRNRDEGSTVEERLQVLAIDLATNYCTVSFGEEEKKNVKITDIFDDSKLKDPHISELFDNVFIKEEKHLSSTKEKYLSDIIQHRNILIIGAGATYESFSCIPLGAQVIKMFEEKYAGKISAFPSVKEKYDNYKKELLLQKKELDFENILSLYSELILTPEELRNEISDLFDFKHPPSLFYEIVAHLFKHSFIDVIINFNFDELLDKAIEEELGKDNYYHILSDGDCVPIEDMMIDGRLKIPIYIKPHGTVSHKSTLRFTKRHYLDVPENIRLLLIKLISGERGEIIGKKKEQVNKIEQINLISVGFNMDSLEFGDIINEYLPRQSKIYHFCWNERDERDNYFIEKVYKRFYGRAFQYHIRHCNKGWTDEELHNHIYSRIAVERFKDSDNKLTTPFSEAFSFLWRSVYYLFKKDLTPRSIARHEIISYLFYDISFAAYTSNDLAAAARQRLSDTYDKSISYFLDRAIVEIAIAINRNNGIIEISEILGGRAGLYYKRYRDLYFRLHKTDKDALSINDLICQFIGLKWKNEIDNTFSTNIFHLDLRVFDKIKKRDRILKAILSKKKYDKSKLDDRLRAWIKKDLVTNNEGMAKIVTNDATLDRILEKFASLVHASDDFNENNPVSILVLYRLFKAAHISHTFISNFQTNHNKLVFNGNTYDLEKNKNSEQVFMIDELARLFIKSSRKHYYSIRPRYHDPKNYLSESFSKSKLLNTNLAVEYVFRNMFLNGDWDIALIISETGSILDFLKDVEVKKKKCLLKRKIIVLNSFDAVKQLHYKLKGIRQINEEQNDKYNNLILGTPVKQKGVSHTFSLPSIQHNHHMMLFIKRVAKGTSIDERTQPVYKVKDSLTGYLEPLFTMSDSMYIYRQGFSNNLNPLVIGMKSYVNMDEQIVSLQHDFRKLLRIFSTTLYRALAFEGIQNISDLNINLNQYQKWFKEEEVEKINIFLRYLYHTDSANFTIEKTI